MAYKCPYRNRDCPNCPDFYDCIADQDDDDDDYDDGDYDDDDD